MTLKNSLALLKPKANKLLNLLTNWKYFSKEEKIELAHNIEKLALQRKYPKPIRQFFRFPAFRELIESMKEGKLLRKPVEELEESSYHPPIEIQNLQILVESFHKLVHLDYQKNLSKDPFTSAKVYVSNILDYLSVIDAFSPYSGPLVEEILEYLFQSIRTFMEKLISVARNNQKRFSHDLIEALFSEKVAVLQNLGRGNYKHSLIDEWLTVMSYLNIDPKLGMQSRKLSNLATFNMHKLINQVNTLLTEKRDFYQRNAPFYKPTELKKAISEKLKEVEQEGKKLTGQQVNEMFYHFFWQSRYEIIAAKQEGINKKLRHLANELKLVRKSIRYFTGEYKHFLPKNFCSYLENHLSPVEPSFDYLSRPNFLACLAILGFNAIQTDYLIELLAKPDETNVSEELSKYVKDIVPILFSFAEQYYRTYPVTSFFFIRNYYEHFMQEGELAKSFTPEEILKKLDDSLLLFLPIESDSFDHLEATYYKILDKCAGLAGYLEENSPEQRLLKEKLNFAKYADLPSYAEIWFVIGELTGLLYLLLTKSDRHFAHVFSFWKELLLQKPFVEILFFSIDKPT